MTSGIRAIGGNARKKFMIGSMKARTCLYQPSTKPTGTAQAVPSATPTKTRLVDVQMSRARFSWTNKFPRLGGNGVRRWNQAGIDQAAGAHGVPGEHDERPRGQDEKRTLEPRHQSAIPLQERSACHTVDRMTR